MKYTYVLVFAWLGLVGGVFMIGPNVVFADTPTPLAEYSQNSFELVPKVKNEVIQDTYNALAKTDTRHKFWETYNNQASNLGLKEQVATGVMNRNTLIGYAAVIINFISSLGLVIGAGFIIMSGYKYAMSIFGTKEDGGGAIKNAFIGVAIMSMSYGIFRLLTRIFIE